MRKACQHLVSQGQLGALPGIRGGVRRSAMGSLVGRILGIALPMAPRRSHEPQKPHLSLSLGYTATSPRGQAPPGSTRPPSRIGGIPGPHGPERNLPASSIWVAALLPPDP
eukprot:8754855-Pyramimonas_sp.AAC.2